MKDYISRHAIIDNIEYGEFYFILGKKLPRWIYWRKKTCTIAYYYRIWRPAPPRPPPRHYAFYRFEIYIDWPRDIIDSFDSHAGRAMPLAADTISTAASCRRSSNAPLSSSAPPCLEYAFHL